MRSLLTRPLPRRSLLASGAAGALAPAIAPTADPATAAGARSSRGGRKGRRPNIVLILADDFGYGALGAYGQQVLKTPHLDRLAAEGIAFTQGYSGASVCAPSRTTLLTGMHGGHARVRSNSFRTTGVQPRLLARDTTIAQVLAAAGYRTGIYGKWGFGDDDYLTPTPIGVTCSIHQAADVGTGDFAVSNRHDPSHPLQKGFDAFEGLVTTEHAFQYWPDYLWRQNRRVRLPANEGEVKGTYAPQVYLEGALDFIDAHRDEEFFLYFAPQLVHFPNQVPDTKPYDDQLTWTPDMKAYASQYTLLDDHVGQIIARLKEHGLAEDTLVIFTGDNGPTPNEHLLVGSTRCADVQSPSPDSALADYLWDTNGGLRAGKHSLYEGGIRVPLVVWGPGVVRQDGAAVADNPWGSVDLLPTLADFAGITAPSDVDGVSVRDWITGERRGRIAHPPLYFERPPNTDQNLDGGPPAQLVYTTALRWGNWKAVRHAPGQDPSIPDSQAKFELYDLDSDRGELLDVSLLNPDVAARMQKRMRANHAPPPYARKAYRPRRTGREFRLRG
ncbi:arylsulfatase [Nocardioides fonticola]|uniref:Arylsulfatase n=1 Tax=Nocardioides fonticola TaxID=450363 RepID=A0ABP7XFM1_9ACTN